MNPAPDRPVLPLSIDWEDWYQLCCPPYEGPEAHVRFENRLERATEATLALCEGLGARATWFCLADQALRHPETVRQIVRAGHEVALHGLDHRRAFELDRAAFRSRTAQGRRLLEDLAGVQVRGFRAPEWSLRGTAADFVEVLGELAFTYDSSRAPLKLLGDPAWPREAHRLGLGLVELPPPVWGRDPFAVPLWGWAMRLLPEPFLRGRLRDLATRGTGNPLVLHPWELDEGQPGLPEASLGHRFAHSAGLEGYGARLRRLLSPYRLVSLGAWLEAFPLPGGGA